MFLFVFAAAGPQAQGAFLEKKLDLTLSLLSSSSFEQASMRIASNLDIQQILPNLFLKKAVGYVSLTRFNAISPGNLTLQSGEEYQVELQLRYVKPGSSKALFFLLTGNTLNFGEHTQASLDAGAGFRYALGAQSHLFFPAIASLYYPEGVIAVIEPGVVWHGLSLSLRIANVFSQSSALPHGDSSLALGYRLDF